MISAIITTELFPSQLGPYIPIMDKNLFTSPYLGVYIINKIFATAINGTTTGYKKDVLSIALLFSFLFNQIDSHIASISTTGTVPIKKIALFNNTFPTRGALST